jgi:hypothetical protein
MLNRIGVHSADQVEVSLSWRGGRILFATGPGHSKILRENSNVELRKLLYDEIMLSVHN